MIVRKGVKISIFYLFLIQCLNIYTTLFLTLHDLNLVYGDESVSRDFALKPASDIFGQASSYPPPHAWHPGNQQPSRPHLSFSDRFDFDKTASLNDRFLCINRNVLGVKLLSGRPKWSPRGTTAISFFPATTSTTTTTAAKCLSQYESYRIWGGSSTAQLHRIPDATSSYRLSATTDPTAADGFPGPTTIAVQSSSAAAELPDWSTANTSDTIAVPESKPGGPASPSPRPETAAYRFFADGRQLQDDTISSSSGSERVKSKIWYQNTKYKVVIHYCARSGKV